MYITWFTWKDASHPEAGGAEKVAYEISQRLAQDGHTVTFLVGGYPGCIHSSEHNGVHIYRMGNRFTVYIFAMFFYIRHLRKSTDLIIEEINTIPFFTFLYTRKKRFLLFHQLCREIWFYQFPFPGNVIGYIGEWIYLKVLSFESAITVSKSTKSDLMKHGFKNSKIHVITEGIDLPSLAFNKKSSRAKPLVISLGTIRPMKRTLHQIQAFEIAKKSLSQLQMIVAGDAQSAYGRKALQYIENSPYHASIKVYGKIGLTTKTKLLKKSHLLLVTPVKEGWGLTVTEANRLSTPAIGYNVDGIRDSIQHNKTGMLSLNKSPQSLANTLIYTLKNDRLYDKLSKAAYRDSLQHTYDATYSDFVSVILKK